MFAAVREQIARFFLFIADFFGFGRSTNAWIQQQLDEDAFVLSMSPEQFEEYNRALEVAMDDEDDEFAVDRIMEGYAAWYSSRSNSSR